MIINRATPKQATITAASRIILNSWKLSGFLLVEDERYQSRFGFWRPYVTDVIHRYLASDS
jgi:hypothetical protein